LTTWLNKEQFKLSR